MYITYTYIKHTDYGDGPEAADFWAAANSQCTGAGKPTGVKLKG